MQDTHQDFEELEESQFPAFPVVFRAEPEPQPQDSVSLAKSRGKAAPRLPDHEVKELEAYMNHPHQCTYPELFKESWEDGLHNVDNFFAIYQPLDGDFVREMLTVKQELKIVRLSAHKLYIGQFQQGKCSGRSIVVFKNGNIYEGMMAHNKREGKGFYLQASVGWFKGSFSNDLKTGEGIEVVYRKWAFKGVFLNGLRQQKGLFVEQSGVVYLGQWKLGIMHGKGTLKTAQSVYQGILVNSLKHGQGEERFSNGDLFRGDYQNNLFDGFGTYNWQQGQATYEGSFKNGLRHGKGKWSSGETKYSGSYSEGLKEGYGELYFPSGNFYKGNFVNDKREGYGEMFWTDGSFYKGDWKGGVQNGKGQIYITGSEVISGLFENSILVQIIPSLYEKQMEISSLGMQDLFGSQPKLPSAQKTRTFSESKQHTTTAKKKLARIEEPQRKKISIKDNIYFQNSDKTRANGHLGQSRSPPGHGQTPTNRHLHNHSHSYEKEGHGQDCKCMRRLQNFRLRQRLKTKLNESKVENTLH